MTTQNNAEQSAPAQPYRIPADAEPVIVTVGGQTIILSPFEPSSSLAGFAIRAQAISGPQLSDKQMLAFLGATGGKFSIDSMPIVDGFPFEIYFIRPVAYTGGTSENRPDAPDAPRLDDMAAVPVMIMMRR